MKFTNSFFIALLTTLLFVACSSEDGQDGVNGLNGIDGIDGADGADGETGTANVIFSDWIDRDFLLDGAQASNLMGLEVFNASELNPVTDVVLVYGERDTGSDADGIYMLPYILASQNEYYGFGLFNVTGGTGLQIRVNTLDGGTNLFTFFSSYRYVIIPGGISTSGKSSINYTKMTYQEIIDLFNIPE